MVFRETKEIEVLLDRSDWIVGDVVIEARAGENRLDKLARDADGVI